MASELELVSPTGERHGLINSVANSVKDDGFKNMTPENKTRAEKKKKDEQRLIRARYLNSRGSNERLTKPYMRWGGEPIQTWHFIPGEIYMLPKGLVDEVNDPNKRIPKRMDLLDSKGIPMKADSFHDPIHSFVPVDF